MGRSGSGGWMSGGREVIGALSGREFEFPSSNESYGAYLQIKERLVNLTNSSSAIEYIWLQKDSLYSK